MNATMKSDDFVTDPHARIDQLEKRALLSSLWLFVLLNLIFRDIHEIVKAEFLTDALNGIYNGREVTEAMFLLGGIIVEVPVAMMLMAWILPIRANRRANVTTALLFAPSRHRHSSRRPRRLLPHRAGADSTRSHHLAGVELGTIYFIGQSRTFISNIV